ncbi:MAG: hypothetical protein JRJ05_00715 [Deltaproteobacteria bacterium]|nr:hypothetical protein [Deltaproteobacteria bacterium]
MMRRRFGRGRKTNPGKSKTAAIDAARSFERITAEKIVAAESLSPISSDEIPDHFAAVAEGESERGGRLVVAFAPRHGGDAALAGLAHAKSLAGDGEFDGEVIAVCPQWSIAARQRLAILSPQGINFRAVAASSLSDAENLVEVLPGDSAFSVPARQVANRVEGAQRDLFLRALAALEGLAAKHGGAVRGVGASVELVLVAQRIASIRIENPSATENHLVLETLQPDKATERLDSGSLAVAMDRLEGSLRKRLNDRRMRGSEEGMRAQLVGSLIEAEGIRDSVRWPLAGSEPEVVDLVGVGAGGTVVVGALRSKIALPELAAILDGVAAVRPALAGWLAGADAPVRLDAIRLLFAAKEFSPGALHLLSMLSLDHVSYDIHQPRGRDPQLRLRESGVAAPMVMRTSVPAVVKESETAADEAEAQQDRAPSRRRRRGQRSSTPREPREPRESVESAEPSANRYDEVSIFDMDEGSDSDAGARRSRRGRRRGRRSRPDGSDAASDRGESESQSDAPSAAEEGSESRPRSSRGRGGRSRGGKRSDAPKPIRDVLPPEDEADEDLADLLIPPIADIEEPSLVPQLAYDDDADESALAVADEVVPPTVEPAAVEPEPEPEGMVRKPRRRAAFVVHADRRSLIAGLLLARDVRLVEGIWVYPQTEMMTFFRSVATDLHEQTPIYVIGFTASPARDTIQAASLYSDRIAWFDHHDWPPEDLESLREAIGERNVIVTPGAESSIPAVLTQRIRRSRFSDKIVELATGRFSQHDYERWGRVWWERLGAAAAKHGERRADIDPLLIGRPSDLAREASDASTPPPPPEVEFVASRDFRLVHFGGYRMIVVPTPPEFDAHLTARIARERYGSQLSLAFTEGEEVLVLGGDESSARRNLDLMSMAAHLATKHDWIEAPPSDDYVARVRVHDLAAQPDRLDEVIGEIAMGRSILEG